MTLSTKNTLPEGQEDPNQTQRADIQNVIENEADALEVKAQDYNNRVEQAAQNPSATKEVWDQLITEGQNLPNINNIGYFALRHLVEVAVQKGHYQAIVEIGLDRYGEEAGKTEGEAFGILLNLAQWLKEFNQPWLYKQFSFNQPPAREATEEEEKKDLLTDKQLAQLGLKREQLGKKSIIPKMERKFVLPAKDEGGKWEIQ